MSAELLLQFLAIFVLILANGFFSLSEFSIIASRKTRLQQLVEEKKRGARRAKRLRNKPDKFLATIQVGITLVGTIAGVFGGATLVGPLKQILKEIPFEGISSTAGPLSVAIIAIVITVTTVVIGELVPKYIALSHPEKYARLVAPPINLFTKLTGFISYALSGTANLIIKFLGVRTSKTSQTITEDEINMMIFEGKEKGVFDATEEQLIKSVFDFADSTVRRALTPRMDVVGISSDSTPSEIIKAAVEYGHSKYPVYEKNIDNIIGVLYTRDLVHQNLNPELIILKDLIRKPIFVPETFSLSRLLRDFQRKKKEFAIVLDEFGGTAGIIALEDVLEELVGEIQDEDDDSENPLIKHSETIAFADGSVWPGAVNELMNCHLPEDDADTLAGLIMEHLERLPEKDEEIIINDMKISILEQKNNRLTRLKLELIHQKNSNDNN
jgi:magnesium and cobalt exporter, CNNM family